MELEWSGATNMELQLRSSICHWKPMECVAFLSFFLHCRSRRSYHNILIFVILIRDEKEERKKQARSNK